MQSVLAQQVMVGNLVDVSLDQLCSKVALAKAQQPCIGVDLERLFEPKGISIWVTLLHVPSPQFIANILTERES